MEAACCYCPTPTKSHNFRLKFSSVLLPSHPIHPQQLTFSRSGRGRRLSNRGSARAGCAKGGPVSEVERELEEEMIMKGGGVSGEDGIGGRWREKCEGEGGGGIAELMECLEREAIMGEDEGKEPSDYNRRALIFDKSSRVFQALKEKDAQKS